MKTQDPETGELVNFSTAEDIEVPTLHKVKTNDYHDGFNKGFGEGLSIKSTLFFSFMLILCIIVTGMILITPKVLEVCQ